MAGKFEAQFKHRDERILKIARPRQAPDAETPVFDAKVCERQIRYTVAFGETITIAATLYGSRQRIIFSEL